MSASKRKGTAAERAVVDYLIARRRNMLSDDIVTQLREHREDEAMLGNDWLVNVLGEAADEIERLREQNEYLKANVEMLLAEARAVRGD